MVAPVCPGFPSDTERGGPPEVDPGGGSLTPMGLLWSEAVWGALGSLSAHGQHVHPQKTGNHPEEAGGFREEVLGLRSGSCGRQLAPGSTGRARRQGASRRRGTCFHPVRPSTPGLTPTLLALLGQPEGPAWDPRAVGLDRTGREVWL